MVRADREYFDQLPARAEASRRGFDRLRREGEWRRCGVGELHRAAADAGGLTWPGDIGVIERRLEDGRIVAVVSDRGRGKTQLGACLLRRWIFERGESGLYVLAADIAERARQVYDEDNHGRDPLAPVKRAGLLVIDEIQERSGTDFDDRTFTAVLDARYAGRRPTLLLGNVQAKAFNELVGPSVASRASEGGAVVVLPWKSFRDRGKARGIE